MVHAFLKTAPAQVRPSPAKTAHGVAFPCPLTQENPNSHLSLCARKLPRPCSRAKDNSMTVVAMDMFEPVQQRKAAGFTNSIGSVLALVRAVGRG